jgi:hypothetical protein
MNVEFFNVDNSISLLEMGLARKGFPRVHNFTREE